MGDYVDAICSNSTPQPVCNSNPFKCLSPKNPHMMKLERRVETFDSPNWPCDRITSTPFDFAVSGFYHLGDQDRVKCWYCNGGVKNCEKNDVISEEHAKWYPLCEFLLERQGVQYVKSVLQKYPHLIRPDITDPTKAVEAQCLMKYLKTKPSLAFSFPVPLEDPRVNVNLHKLKIEEEMRNGKNVEVAMSLGFDKKKIEHVLT